MYPSVVGEQRSPMDNTNPSCTSSSNTPHLSTVVQQAFRSPLSLLAIGRRNRRQPLTSSAKTRREDRRRFSSLTQRWSLRSGRHRGSVGGDASVTPYKTHHNEDDSVVTTTDSSTDSVDSPTVITIDPINMENRTDVSDHDVTRNAVLSPPSYASIMGLNHNSNTSNFAPRVVDDSWIGLFRSAFGLKNKGSSNNISGISNPNSIASAQRLANVTASSRLGRIGDDTALSTKSLCCPLSSNGGGGGGCGLVPTKIFIGFVTLIGIVSLVVGIGLGTLRAPVIGQEFLTISMLMIGIGLVIISVSGIAWRISNSNPPSNQVPVGNGRNSNNNNNYHNLSGIGGASHENSGGSDGRFLPSMDNNIHPFSGMLHAEFPCQVPPPSYDASMQQALRLRRFLIRAAATNPLIERRLYETGMLEIGQQSFNRNNSNSQHQRSRRRHQRDRNGSRRRRHRRTHAENQQTPTVRSTTSTADCMDTFPIPETYSSSFTFQDIVPWPTTCSAETRARVTTTNLQQRNVEINQNDTIVVNHHRENNNNVEGWSTATTPSNHPPAPSVILQRNNKFYRSPPPRYRSVVKEPYSMIGNVIERNFSPPPYLDGSSSRQQSSSPSSSHIEMGDCRVNRNDPNADHSNNTCNNIINTNENKINSAAKNSDHGYLIHSKDVVNCLNDRQSSTTTVIIETTPPQPSSSISKDTSLPAIKSNQDGDIQKTSLSTPLSPSSVIIGHSESFQSNVTVVEATVHNQPKYMNKDSVLKITEDYDDEVYSGYSNSTSLPPTTLRTTSGDEEIVFVKSFGFGFEDEKRRRNRMRCQSSSSSSDRSSSNYFDNTFQTSTPKCERKHEASPSDSPTSILDDSAYVSQQVEILAHL